MTDNHTTLGRCQGMTKFRPVFGTYGGLMGDVRDRMRCTNSAVTVVNGVELCGIHSFDERNIQRSTRAHWPNVADNPTP